MISGIKIQNVVKSKLKTSYGPFSLYCFSIANDFNNNEFYNNHITLWINRFFSFQNKAQLWVTNLFWLKVLHEIKYSRRVIKQKSSSANDNLNAKDLKLCLSIHEKNSDQTKKTSW